MLSIGKLGIGQERYYLDQVAEGAEDYYSGEGEAEGQWLGDAAEDLGLDGTVEADQLTAMLTGHNPATGEPLGLRAVGGRGAVPGFDLTFSVPKSASLLWALGNAETSAAVTAALDRSLDAALGYLQREACWTRRGADAEFVRGNGFLAAGYHHRSSRNGDPQVHVHALVANVTQGPDGKWTRLYHPAIYEHAKTAGYIFEAQFRQKLTQSLGARWQEVRNGIAEIGGFDDAHLRAFSTRRAEIMEAAGPGASARSRQIANLTTREAKEPGIGSADLRRRWHEQAKGIGLDLSTVRIGERATPDHPALTVEQLDLAVTEGVSHFDRRDVIQAVAGLLQHGGEAAEIERTADAFLASDAVLPISEGTREPRFTTRRIWELERKALATAERMRSQGVTPAGELIAARVIRSRPTLKADQREMVRRLLSGTEGVTVVIGEAGTGKTYAIVVAAEGWAQAGIELRAVAPTWRAANVMRSEGLSATSIASLLGELDHAARAGTEGLANGSVLLVDEAGMVDSATLARLIAHADGAGAKLVLVGDPQQLGEIEAGGLFGALAERTEPIYLDQVIRHHHETDREAAKRIREGEGREALSLYRSEERVIVAPNAEARREAMVRDWQEAFAGGEDALMVAKRNADVEKLNELACAVMRERGRVGGEEIEVGDNAFAAGDQVITRVNDRALDIYNRERWTVAEVNPTDHTVVLKGIDSPREVEVDAAYLSRTNPYGDAPALEHAYAVTTYCAQGTTVDRAYVMADPSMDKQEFYVATSRSREETYLYATPEIQAQREEYAPRSPYLRTGLEHIAEATQRDGSQTAAHDEARRFEQSELPTPALVERRADLVSRGQEEGGKIARLREAAERVEQSRQNVAQAEARIAAAESGGRATRKELPDLRRSYEWVSEGLANREREMAELPRPQADQAAMRSELDAIEQVLADRRAPQIAAARIEPPSYIVRELGERPADSVKRESWDSGVRKIESYRQEHGVTDKSRAFGTRPQERSARKAAERSLRRIQRELGLKRQLARARRAERGIGRGLGR
jgi:conjugative relaxase-like TrwC/TraI family protein